MYSFSVKPFGYAQTIIRTKFCIYVVHSLQRSNNNTFIVIKIHYTLLCVCVWTTIAYITKHSILRWCSLRICVLEPSNFDPRWVTGLKNSNRFNADYVITARSLEHLLRQFMAENMYTIYSEKAGICRTMAARYDVEWIACGIWSFCIQYMSNSLSKLFV